MFPDFLDDPVDIVAQRLLGCELVRTFDSGFARVRIVETEAYDQDDPASHAFHGKSERNRALFGPAGHAYVYFTYGMHYCFNISAQAEGFGSGALIRACEPVEGEELLLVNRPLPPAHRSTISRLPTSSNGQSIPMTRRVELLNGPAKLCQALDIDLRLYGHDLHNKPLELIEPQQRLRDGEEIEATPRIGISTAQDALRRFIIAGNPYVSHNSRTPHTRNTPYALDVTP